MRPDSGLCRAESIYEPPVLHQDLIFPYFVLVLWDSHDSLRLPELALPQTSISIVFPLANFVQFLIQSFDFEFFIFSEDKFVLIIAMLHATLTQLSLLIFFSKILFDISLSDEMEDYFKKRLIHSLKTILN
jgi:hypothetical protein